MRKTLVAVATVAALGAGGISNAQAHDNDAGLFIAGAVIGTVIGSVLAGPPVPVVAAPVVYPPAPPVVYAPAPRVVYAPPVVYAPAPRVVYAPPVVYAPAPRVVYVPQPVMVKRGPPVRAYYPQHGYAAYGSHGQSHRDWH
jgi:hypothetical protein